MLENIYTTKMSANKKQLQNRFLKIRYKSGRTSRFMALVMSVVIAVTMLCATVVMAALDYNKELITLYSKGEIVELENEPFIKENMTYFPLREIFEKLGVFDIETNYISWNDGTILISVSEEAGNEPTYYEINIGSNMIGVAHSKDSPVGVKVSPDDYFTALLVNDITYVPYTYVDYMLNKGIAGSTEKFDFIFTVNAESSSVFVSQKMTWPCSSDIISRKFGKRMHPITKEIKEHNGVDIAAPEGSDVLAAADGAVTEAGFDTEKGNYVVIKSDNNITTMYSHLAAINAASGSDVKQGDVIGTVGNTGKSTGAHLHFELMINGVYYDPEAVY